MEHSVLFQEVAWSYEVLVLERDFQTNSRYVKKAVKITDLRKEENKCLQEEGNVIKTKSLKWKYSLFKRFTFCC
jgi:hypothetical protein